MLGVVGLYWTGGCGVFGYMASWVVQLRGFVGGPDLPCVWLRQTCWHFL